MKVFLVLIILFQGADKPNMEQAEIGSLQECAIQLNALANQPLPPHAKVVQMSCVVNWPDEVKA